MYFKVLNLNLCGGILREAVTGHPKLIFPSAPSGLLVQYDRQKILKHFYNLTDIIPSLPNVINWTSRGIPVLTLLYIVVIV